MAKLSTKAARAPANEPAADADALAENGDREAETIALIKAAFQEDSGGAEWKTSVYRVVPGAGGRHVREIWLFDCQPLELLTLREKVAGDYGAGRFRARVIKNLVPFKQYDFEIELSPAAARAFADRQRETPASIAPVPAPIAANDGGNSALMAMVQQQGQMLERLAARLDAAPGGGVGSVKQMLELMQLMREMQPKAADPAAIFEQALSLAERITKASGGGGGGETSLLDLAREAFPMLREAMARGNAALPAPGVGQYADPAPAPLTLAPYVARPANMPAAQHMPPAATGPALDATAAAAVAAAGIDVQQLAGIVGHLVNQAAAGVQPNLLSDWVTERLPPIVFDFLESTGDPVAALVQFFPGVNNYRAWFTALIESLYDPAEDGPAVDEGNTAGHGAAVQQPSG